MCYSFVLGFLTVQSKECVALDNHLSRYYADDPSAYASSVADAFSLFELQLNGRTTAGGADADGADAAAGCGQGSRLQSRRAVAWKRRIFPRRPIDGLAPLNVMLSVAFAQSSLVSVAMDRSARLASIR